MAKKKIAAWKKGKWVGVPLTADQQEAQRIWQQANERKVNLAEFLKTNTNDWSREKAHKRLDWYLDWCEKTEQRARQLFPEVKDSFTIAEMDL